jgi:hypothetical protein
MPEVSDAELAVLRNSQALLAKLNGDARTRPLIEQAVKVHHPEVETEADVGARLAKPHIEQFTAEVVTPLQEELKALREQREAQATQTTQAQMEAAFGQMRQRGFTDDGIERVKALMVERSIPDPLAAAALFNELNPPAPQEAPGWTPAAWNYAETATDNDLKGLFANPEAWGDKTAATVLNEIRVGQAA